MVDLKYTSLYVGDVRNVWNSFLIDDIFKSSLMGQQPKSPDHLLPHLQQSKGKVSPQTALILFTW